MCDLVIAVALLGLFAPFYDDHGVKFFGVEAEGEGFASGHHACSITNHQVGVFHGARLFVLQDGDGQITPAHSISAGLDYPGVGPEHCFYADSGRACYLPVTDTAALEATRLLCRTEGILPALESAHALAALPRVIEQLPAGATIVLGLSGRGDKDVYTLRGTLEKIEGLS